jgi:hypothetical protein
MNSPFELIRKPMTLSDVVLVNELVVDDGLVLLHTLIGRFCVLIGRTALYLSFLSGDWPYKVVLHRLLVVLHRLLVAGDVVIVSHHLLVVSHRLLVVFRRLLVAGDVFIVSHHLLVVSHRLLVVFRRLLVAGYVFIVSHHLLVVFHCLLVVGDVFIVSHHLLVVWHRCCIVDIYTGVLNAFSLLPSYLLIHNDALKRSTMVYQQEIPPNSPRHDQQRLCRL